jgi:hypothetical protein
MHSYQASIWSWNEPQQASEDEAAASQSDSEQALHPRALASAAADALVTGRAESACADQWVAAGSASAMTKPSPPAGAWGVVPSTRSQMQMAGSDRADQDTQETSQQESAAEQQHAMMHAQTASCTPPSSLAAPAPSQLSCAHAAGVAARRSSRLEKGCSQRADAMDSDARPDAVKGEACREASAQVACSSAHLHSKVSGEDAAAHSGLQSRHESSAADLSAATTQRSVQTATTGSVPNSARTRTASRNRPTTSAEQHPLHSAKVVWLSFVRRAYRKFGKQMLSDVDLRWRTRGASGAGGCMETHRRCLSARLCTARIRPHCDCDCGCCWRRHRR